MIREHEHVVLMTDLPEHDLQSGDVGVVVMVHGTQGYEVEFITLDGQTVAVVSLNTSQIRPVGHGEIAHARPVKAA